MVHILRKRAGNLVIHHAVHGTGASQRNQEGLLVLSRNMESLTPISHPDALFHGDREGEVMSWPRSCHMIYFPGNIISFSI